MEQYVDFYCKENNKELNRLVDQILNRRFSWIPQKDYDDFYSIAAQVVWNCERSFDSQKIKSENFKSYISHCIYNKVKSQVTSMNRKKRMINDEYGEFVHNISIDATIGDSDHLTIADSIPSDFNIENEVFEQKEDEYSPQMLLYLQRLSKLQKEVLQLIADGFSANEIKQQLHITQKQYADCYAAIHSHRNVAILYQKGIGGK